MLLILPLAAFVFFFEILRRKGMEWRKSVLASAVFWGTCVAVITETLGLWNQITRGGVAIFWLAICVASWFYLRKLPRGAVASDLPRTGERLDRITKGLLFATGLVAVAVFITAVVAPPMIWDAMEYHLPRVVMWMSNHNVRFYPTPDYAQLIFGPWAEYAMMHADILWSGDRFVNLVEFFSYLGSAIGVSLIAELLGAGVRGQALAAIVCATIPEGVLEASGPMNTYVGSFWMMTTVVFLILWNDDSGWFNTICVGLAAGLAILTKGDAFVDLPFMVLACWMMGNAASRVRYLKRCGVFLVLIVAINTPQFVRCYGFTGSPLGLPFADGGPRLHWMMDVHGPRAVAAGVLRNVSLDLAVPGKAINARTEHVIRAGIRMLGVNPDDPRMVWPGETFYMNYFSSHEIYAGNPIHLALLLVALAIVLWKRRSGEGRKAFWYALGIIAGYVFFCGLLRWQIYGARHHLPLFVLGSALIGLVLERYFSQRTGIAVCCVILAVAGLFSVANRTRGLVRWHRVDNVYHPRAELYLYDQHKQFAKYYVAAEKVINSLDCNRIGIDSYTKLAASEINNSPRSFYVYPLLATIHADGRSRTVWYTGVHNLTTRYAQSQPHPAPCAVICLDCTNVPEKWKEYGNVGGRASVFDNIVVFGSKGTTAGVPPGKATN